MCQKVVYLEVGLQDLQLFLCERRSDAFRLTRLQGGTGTGVVAAAVVTVTYVCPSENRQEKI